MPVCDVGTGWVCGTVERCRVLHSLSFLLVRYTVYGVRRGREGRPDYGGGGGGG